MTDRIILASGSEIRQRLLRNAGVDFTVFAPRVDENSVKTSLISEGAPPRDIADALAEMKARKVSQSEPDAMVLGCDQILVFNGEVVSKPCDRREAREHLVRLRGQTHDLLSAAVVYRDLAPQWRHIGQVRLTMRNFSDAYLDEYLLRTWDSVSSSVGGYKLEEEGIRLFSRVEGDFFTALGFPLIEVLSYLTLRGTLRG